MTSEATHVRSSRRISGPVLPAFVLLALIAALFPATPAATAPDAIHYQGVLRDAGGEPLDGTYDMVFRFWSAEIGGDEILVDEHNAANGTPVDVDDGLLSVKLGRGFLADGSGPGNYSSLAEVFRDYSDVWIAIDVNGETLSPRVQVISAGHALNAQRAESAADADSLGGMSAGSFIDTSGVAQSKAGPLSVESLEVAGDRIELAGIGAYFEVDAAESGSVLQAGSSSTDDLHLRGGNSVGDGFIRLRGQSTMELASGNGFFYFMDDSMGLQIARLDADGNLSIDGTLEVEGRLIEIGPSGNDPRLDATTAAGGIWELGYESATDGFIRGTRGGDIEFWTADRVSIIDNGVILTDIESNGDLSTDGVIASGGTNPPGYNRLGLGSADGAGISTVSDTYIADDFEVDGVAYFEGPIIFNEDGGNKKQQIQFYENGSNNERFQWDGDSDSKRYEFSDDVRIFGDLLADTKNFVQNHPEREDLQIVYTSLEGDEATVFTRGFARLEKGRARIELGETFRHVANPDLGLTAHLTPRGTWASLYVEELTPETLVVRAAPDAPQDLVFDYLVLGLRVGYEAFPVVREKGDEAFLPPDGWFAADTAGDPAKERATALARYRRMNKAAYGTDSVSLEGTRALKQAIGQRPRGLVYERGQELAVRDRPDVSGDADYEAPGRAASRAARAAARTDAVVPRSRAAAEEPEDGADSASPDRAGVLRAEAGELTRMVPVGEPVEAGDVLAIDPSNPGAMRRAREAEDPRVFGIVAGDPGLILGAGAGDDEAPDTSSAGAGQAAVALGGVAHCKVDARLGAIRPGDLLAASPTPGHAMRVTDPLPGTVLGKALEGHAEGTGLIEVLVMPR